MINRVVNAIKKIKRSTALVTVDHYAAYYTVYCAQCLCTVLKIYLKYCQLSNSSSDAVMKSLYCYTGWLGFHCFWDSVSLDGILLKKLQCSRKAFTLQVHVAFALTALMPSSAAVTLKQQQMSMSVLLVAFFNSFRKGPVVCRGLDLDLSGKVAKKKRLWHGKEVATPTVCSSLVSESYHIKVERRN